MEIITRFDAKKRGLTRYYTGKTCPRGHCAERFTSTAHCIVCDRERIKEWRVDNADRENRKLKERRRIGDRLAKHNERNVRWRAENPGYMARWRANNPEKHKANVHKRLARQKNAGGVVTPAEIKEIGRLQNGRCAYCRQKLGQKYQIDHIVPISKGGRNEARNIQLLCRKTRGASCNQRKHARDPIDFAQSLGFLL